MALALWGAGALAVLVFFGTWALQIVLVLVQISARLLGGLALLAVGLGSLVALAFIDRAALAHLWRNERVHADNAALLARERWR